jgi:hypothetical protein
MLSTRRTFLGAAAVGASLATLPRLRAAEKKSGPVPRLGISSYSYWHFRDPKVSIEKVIDYAADIGVEGVDMLNRQM